MSSRGKAYWRHSNSVAAQEQTPETRARVRRNQVAFEGDQKSMRAWAAAGFTSGLSSDETESFSYGDGVLGLKDEGEEG